MKALAKWSIDDYHQMIEAGILRNRRVELLVGEIVEMSPETPIHYSTAKRGVRYLEQLLTGRADVRFNGPITLLDSEPEPDIAIVRLPESLYNNRHPRPEDIFWLIEIANTSLKTDVDLKTSIYATAAIQEYWVLDLAARQLIVLQSPQNGQYVTQQVINAGEITPLAFPDIRVSVGKLIA